MHTLNTFEFWILMDTSEYRCTNFSIQKIITQFLIDKPFLSPYQEFENDSLLSPICLQHLWTSS